MIAALMVFVLVTGLVLGLYGAARAIPKMVEERRLELRLHDVGPAVVDVEESVLMQAPSGPLPGIDRLLARSPGAASLTRLIAQSGVRTTPGAIVLCSVGAGVAAAAITMLFVRTPFAAPAASVLGLATPFLWLIRHQRWASPPVLALTC